MFRTSLATLYLLACTPGDQSQEILVSDADREKLIAEEPDVQLLDSALRALGCELDLSTHSVAESPDGSWRFFASGLCAAETEEVLFVAEVSGDGVVQVAAAAWFDSSGEELGMGFTVIDSELVDSVLLKWVDEVHLALSVAGASPRLLPPERAAESEDAPADPNGESCQECIGRLATGHAKKSAEIMEGCGDFLCTAWHASIGTTSELHPDYWYGECRTREGNCQNEGRACRPYVPIEKLLGAQACCETMGGIWSSKEDRCSIDAACRDATLDAGAVISVCCLGECEL